MGEGIRREICQLVNNSHGLTFHKLVIRDTCLFDEFCDEVAKSKKDMKCLTAIISRMGSFGDNLVPKKYFRQLKDIGRSDIFEFKQDNLRVYVQLVKPDVVILLGGTKNSQTKDIRKIKRIISYI